MFFLRMKVGILLAIILVVCTCIDPYTPKLKGYGSLLSVDALITDANTSCIVKLTWTMQNQNDIPPGVSDANVYLTDDAGNTSTLINAGSGIYKTDTNEFRGTEGRTYVLHIATSDGKEYESDPCLMYAVPEIDSVYFEKDQQLINNSTQSLDGVSIYLDSKEGTDNQYYRWAYEETWKFKVPYPKKYDYVKTPDYPDSPKFPQVKDVKEFCWKSNRSGEVLISSMSGAGKGGLLKQPVSFIPTGLTDKLLIQYSILVNQYSISKREYDFWNNLKQINETGNDIFARQPYSVLSNLHSTTNPQERVLGYFQVSAVSQKRKNLLYRDVALMGLPFYSYPCITLKLDLSWLPDGCRGCIPPTWDLLYWHLCIANDYTFIEPINYNVADGLLYLVFTRPECANCELTGTSKKPDFWVDLN
jgi:hypothetical protein